jgi:hypothetical protein
MFGLVYWSTVFGYLWIAEFIFPTEDQPREPTELDSVLIVVLNTIAIGSYFVRDVLLLFVFLLTLIFNTFWVQDIFDLLMTKIVDKAMKEGKS